MRDDNPILLTLSFQFVIMALLAFGGANAIVPEIHRQAVELRGWMTERQFADLLAISQAAPGPNVMIVMLVGHHLAGVAGAIVAAISMCGPTAVLAVFLARTWDRFRNAPWRELVQTALVPISVGLIGASVIIFISIASTSVVAGAITLATAAGAYWTRWSPLWFFAVAIGLGFAGLV